MPIPIDLRAETLSVDCVANQWESSLGIEAAELRTRLLAVISNVSDVYELQAAERQVCTAVIADRITGSDDSLEWEARAVGADLVADSVFILLKKRKVPYSPSAVAQATRILVDSRGRREDFKNEFRIGPDNPLRDAWQTGGGRQIVYSAKRST